MGRDHISIVENDSLKLTTTDMGLKWNPLIYAITIMFQ